GSRNGGPSSLAFDQTQAEQPDPEKDCQLDRPAHARGHPHHTRGAGGQGKAQPAQPPGKHLNHEQQYGGDAPELPRRDAQRMYSRVNPSNSWMSAVSPFQDMVYGSPWVGVKVTVLPLWVQRPVATSFSVESAPV